MLKILFLGEEFRDCGNHIGVFFGRNLAVLTELVGFGDCLGEVSENVRAESVGEEVGLHLGVDVTEFLVIAHIDQRTELYERIFLCSRQVDVYVLIALFYNLDVVNAVFFEVEYCGGLTYLFVIYENVRTFGQSRRLPSVSEVTDENVSLTSPSASLITGGGLTLITSSSGHIAMKCGDFAVNDADFALYRGDRTACFTFFEDGEKRAFTPLDGNTSFSYEHSGSHFACTSSSAAFPASVVGTIYRGCRTFAFKTRCSGDRTCRVGFSFVPKTRGGDAFTVTLFAINSANPYLPNLSVGAATWATTSVKCADGVRPQEISGMRKPSLIEEYDSQGSSGMFGRYIINGVSNWINGGNAKYDEIERCTNSIQKSNKEFVDLISISWIFADNYLKTDYPEMYDTLCQNILTSPKYASTITQVKIDLSGKATVYFNVPSYAAGFKPVSGVQVQYKKNNGSYSMLADLANPYAKSASHSITLSNSDTYTYRVRTYARLTTGKIEYSDWSEEYTTLANPAETPEIYCKVGVIGVDVRVKNNYFLSTGFNESQSGVVTTVEIYRRRQGESGKKLIGTISDVDRVNLFTDKNPGTTKCYYSARTVVRYNGKTYYSKYSQEVCTIMSGNIPKDPRLDINIRANSSSPKTRAVTYADAANGFSIELAWDKIDGISTYEVYRKLDEAKLYVYIGKTDSGNTSFVDNTVSEAGRYDYIIKFYQDIGGEKVLCGESQSASVLVERVAQQTETVEIKKGKTATISINSGNLSDGSTVSWSTSSDCITLTPSEDGTSCEVKANSKGSATVTVTITHADGSTVSDTFEIEAKSKGVFATIFDIILAPFRAIINLFKKLFGK